MGDLQALAGKLPLLDRLIRRDCPESTKRYIGILCARALCLALLIVAAAVVVAVLRSASHDVGSGTVAALASLVAGVSSLGTLCFRKKEPVDGQEGGAA